MEFLEVHGDAVTISLKHLSAVSVVITKFAEKEVTITLIFHVNAMDPDPHVGAHCRFVDNPPTEERISGMVNTYWSNLISNQIPVINTRSLIESILDQL